MIKIKIVLLIAFAQALSLQAQKLNWGLSLGTSLNKTALKSEVSIEDNIYDNNNLLGGIGLNIGAHTKLNLADKWVLFSNLEYFRIHQACKPIFFKDNSGNDLDGGVGRRIVNNTIQLSSLAGYRLNNFTFAGGIYLNNLIWSSTVLKGDSYSRDIYLGPGAGENIKRRSNTYFKAFSLGASVLVAYRLNKTSLSLKYNHGFTDKVGSSDNIVKEYEKSLILGLWIYFN